MRNEIIDIIKNRNIWYCAKCRHPLKSEFDNCINGCYQNKNGCEK